MDQEKIGKLIKQIRKDNHLTQKDFSEKYNVSYQAVSNWENGKNIPDISLLKQIAIDFNLSIDEILNGNVVKDKASHNKKIFYMIIFLILIIGIIVLIKISNNKFEFNTISSGCENFKISGSLAYNNNQKSIFINKINYCGKNDNTKYNKITCDLYEKNNNIESKISTYEVQDNNINLEEFLNNIILNIDDYQSVCKKYNNDSLFLRIKAYDDNNQITSYEVPLSLDKSCQ